MTTAKSPTPSPDGLLSPPATNAPGSYVPGSHAASVRTHNDEVTTAMLARRDVVDAARQRAEVELADLNEALQLLAAPVFEETNVRRIGNAT